MTLSNEKMNACEKMNAWLITWEGTSPKITDENRIIGILGSRRSYSFVAELIEFIYLRNSSTVSEMAYMANRPKKKPFPAERVQVNGVPHGNRLTCGHNPFIYARKVEGLKIARDGDVEIITWKEPDNYRWKNKQEMQVEVEKIGDIRTIKKSTKHSLSREMEALYA